MPVNPVPTGFHSITPHLVIRGAAKAIEFYKQAFGAEALGAMSMPGSDKIMHATIKIGDSMIMLADDFPEWGSNSPQECAFASGDGVGQRCQGPWWARKVCRSGRHPRSIDEPGESASTRYHPDPCTERICSRQSALRPISRFSSSF